MPSETEAEKRKRGRPPKSSYSNISEISEAIAQLAYEIKMLETAASQNLEVSEDIDQLDSDFNLLDNEEIYAMNATIHKQPSTSYKGFASCY